MPLFVLCSKQCSARGHGIHETEDTTLKVSSYFQIPGILFAGLLFGGMVIASARAEEQKPPVKLSLEEKEAIHSLILSLEALKATPGSATEIVEWIRSQADQSQAELEAARARVQNLKAEIEKLEQKKAELQNRLNALIVGRALLTSQGIAPPKSESQPSSSEPAPSQSSPANETSSGPSAPAEETKSADSGNAEGIVFFKEKVHPILQKNCFECHGPEKQKSGLRLDSRETALKGGDYGEDIVPGDPDKSFLIQAIRYQGDIKMPPKQQLAEGDIEILTEWIKRGAPWSE